MDEYVVEYLSDVDLESLEEIVEELLDEAGESSQDGDATISISEGGEEADGEMAPMDAVDVEEQEESNADYFYDDDEEQLDYSGPSM